MELLTGKNKEQFEKWYDDKYRTSYIQVDPRQDDIEFYSEIPFEFQIGVYLAYYDSLGINITLNQHDLQSRYNYQMVYFPNKIVDKVLFSSRNEAYKEAFKKANELINN